MATRSERIKLGVFLTAAVALFAVAMVLLTGSKLLEKQRTYTIRFDRSVSGLEAGAPVKQMGVRVGYVDRLRILEAEDAVKVWVKVRPNTTIRENTRAYVPMQGITGLKYIELKPESGVESTARLEPGSSIEPGTSKLRELSGQATDIALKFESLLNNLLSLTRETNQKRVGAILEKSDKTVTEFGEAADSIQSLSDTTDQFIDNNRDELERAIVSVGDTSDQLDRTLRDVDKLVRDIRSAVNAARLPTTLTELRETNSLVQDRVRRLDIEKTVERVNAALATLRTLLDRASQTLAQNQDSFRVIISNLRAVTENLKQVSRTFQEKPYIRLFGGDPPERKLPSQ